MMKYPAFLKDNGTIGFVAPSFGCEIEPYRTAFNSALQKWKERGYQVDLGPNCYAGEGVGISSTPVKCGTELTEYYKRKENDCLISCGGGELMCEILDYVDFEAIKKADPKWYMGYSDNTNFTFLLTTLCDTASIYGPCAASFGMEPWHQAIHDAYSLLRGEKLVMESYGLWEKEGFEDALAPYNCTEELAIRVFMPKGKGETEEVREGRMAGRLLGGCMDCLVKLIGTKYDRVKEFSERYREDGILWFLEACDLNVFDIRRCMWQMAHAGWFRYVKGFLIGRPIKGEEMIGLDRFQAVLSTASQYQVPVFMDVDLGHLPPAMPLLTGSIAYAEAKDNHLTVRMELQ